MSRGRLQRRSVTTLRDLAVGGVALCALSGCVTAPGQPREPTRLTVHVSDYDAFIDDTLTLLRAHDLEPERVDRERGQIVAGPAIGGQWFEFWRSDVQGPYQAVESSLHTIRRIATITIDADAAESQPTTRQSPPDGAARPAGAYRVSIEVAKSRYSAPERQVTTTSGILGIYSERIPTEEGRRGPRSVGEHWVALGRDGLLEAHLADRLAELPSVDSAMEP